MKESDVGFIFLGLSERAAQIRDGNTNLFKWNVLGLKQDILSYVFPVGLGGWFPVFAIKNPNSLSTNIHIKIFDEEDKEVGYFELRQTEEIQAEAVQEPTLSVQGKNEDSLILTPVEGWGLFSFSTGNSTINIQHPGVYKLKIVDDNNSVNIGRVSFHFVEPQPLTPERIAAIKSDPTARKTVKVTLVCNVCKDSLKVYAALERDDEKQKDRVWYQDIDDTFVCECGKASVDTSYIKRGMHGLLGQRMHDGTQFGYVPLYERSLLEQILDRFKTLVHDNSKEELLQRFIQDHTVILHQFPAEKILFKPPMLNKYIADFAILTPQKELILIEIERSNTRLLKQDGHLAAPLSHAFDQVRDWLHCMDEHRLAILDDLGFSKDDVSLIRGVVIAGVDSGYDAAHLRKLKSHD